jgi:hypothetical protein
MDITILIDRDLEGFDVHLKAGLQEIGWDQLIRVEFKRLRDYGLPPDFPDQEIWRFVQAHRLLLITNNRNNDDETSLQATLQSENTLDALPVITVSDKDALKRSDYRRRAAQKLVDIIFDLDNYLGTGRLYIP